MIQQMMDGFACQMRKIENFTGESFQGISRLSSVSLEFNSLSFCDAIDLLGIAVFIGKPLVQITWKQFLTLGYRHQFCLINWSTVVFPSPGPQFNIEKLKGQDFKNLAEPILQNSEDRVCLINWSDGEYLFHRSNR
jgi:hypothetical protein